MEGFDELSTFFRYAAALVGLLVARLIGYMARKLQ
jgi:phytoene/squalene synthetase